MEKTPAKELKGYHKLVSLALGILSSCITTAIFFIVSMVSALFYFHIETLINMSDMQNLVMSGFVFAFLAVQTVVFTRSSYSDFKSGIPKTICFICSAFMAMLLGILTTIFVEIGVVRMIDGYPPFREKMIGVAIDEYFAFVYLPVFICLTVVFAYVSIKKATVRFSDPVTEIAE